jgi:hypothetical protein
VVTRLPERFAIALGSLLSRPNSLNREERSVTRDLCYTLSNNIPLEVRHNKYTTNDSRIYSEECASKTCLLNVNCEQVEYRGLHLRKQLMLVSANCRSLGGQFGWHHCGQPV